MNIMRNDLIKIEKSIVNENSKFVPVEYLIEMMDHLKYKAKKVIEDNNIDLFWEIPTNCNIHMESPFDLVSKYVDSTYNVRKSILSKNEFVQNRFIIPLQDERYIDYVYNSHPKESLLNSRLLLGKGRIKCDYPVTDRDGYGDIPHNVRTLPDFADGIVPGMSSSQIKEYNHAYAEKMKSNELSEHIFKIDWQWNHLEDLFSSKQVEFPFFVESTSSLIQNKYYRNPSIFDKDNKLSLERFFYVPRLKDDEDKNESLKFTFSNVYLLRDDFEKIITQNSTNNINFNSFNQINIHNELELIINQQLEQITISDLHELTLDNIQNIVEEIVKKYNKEPNSIQSIVENIYSELKYYSNRLITKDNIKSIITESIMELNQENKNKNEENFIDEISEDDLELQYLSLTMQKIIELAKHGHSTILAWMKEENKKLESENNNQQKATKKNESIDKIPNKILINYFDKVLGIGKSKTRSILVLLNLNDANHDPAPLQKKLIKVCEILIDIWKPIILKCEEIKRINKKCENLGYDEIYFDYIQKGNTYREDSTLKLPVHGDNRPEKLQDMIDNQDISESTADAFISLAAVIQKKQARAKQKNL